MGGGRWRTWVLLVSALLASHCDTVRQSVNPLMVPVDDSLVLIPVESGKQQRVTELPRGLNKRGLDLNYEVYFYVTT